MTSDYMFRDEKLQYNINREEPKISALSQGNFDKYAYLTGGEILSCYQSQIIEQDKFTYSSLGKAFEKQIKTIEDVGEKQRKTIEDRAEKQILKTNQNWVTNLRLNDFLGAESRDELNKIKEIEQ